MRDGPGSTMPPGSDEPTRPFAAPPTRVPGTFPPTAPAVPTAAGHSAYPPPYYPAAATRPPGPDVPPAPPPPGPAPAGPPGEVVRYGPGVPATVEPGHPGLTAEHVWRGGTPPKAPRRPGRLRRLLGSALTVILLVVAGVLFYLRFHHTPFHDTGVRITQTTQNGCGVDVTGMITTNGSPGTVSYQWVFRPDPHAPQPLTQTVISGQRAVYVTVAVEGSGQGTASQTVTLQILGPNPMSESVPVVLRCP
jgi:hypothetical protein